MTKKTFQQRLSQIILVFAALASIRCQSPSSETQTDPSDSNPSDPLREYVESTDPATRYEMVFHAEEALYDYYVIRLESQHWLTEKEVTETLWWHWVSFVIPKKLAHETSFLMISGGSTNTKLPEKPDQMLVEAALATHSPAIKVHNIPFQPVTFVGDTVEGRVEDGLIAYGWREFMERGAKDEDAIWLARLPMTKAVIHSMDAVVDYTGKELGLNLGKYVVAGGSKRGWTTWTTAAMDDRVVAMAPIVIDLLNLVPSFQHHWRSYGFWAPAVKDYVREGIMDWMGSEEYDRLLEITEPYSFIEVFRDIPKLLINGSGDQFFLPDSWKFYWDDLSGEKHLVYIPNAGHSLDNSDAMQILLGFYKHILMDEARPEYSWEVTDTHIKVTVDPQNPPVQVKLWEAHNPEARDFRIDVFGPKWMDTVIPVQENGVYQIPIQAPDKGWKGHFVEITYAGKAPIKLTTGVKVLPETYPFDPYKPEKPRGTPKK
ncbi:PhoPQ-activated pathogenicity-related protein [Lunatimonas lonarensis]|uniref:PhoPQ-activated pathogenicity-related protein n=1 Tax=Lunatimonas lonarensis TaxID=1232681 RepID=R7ZPV2_9BACT|nr:PhoPQ-activated pathogenicity-related family protein [Lunatimonas lonarensis]EON76135.1 PhoPQ-activated pathogenicity-related protein [Lunatimonas lonarensis]